MAHKDGEERTAALAGHLDRAIRDAESNPHGGKVLLRLDDAKALRALLSMDRSNGEGERQ